MVSGAAAATIPGMPAAPETTSIAYRIAVCWMVKLSGKTDPCQAANTLPAIAASTAATRNARSL
jgi:hypothetical protein